MYLDRAYPGYAIYPDDARRLARTPDHLKDLGFSLEQIGPVLKNEVDAAQLRGMLLMRRNDAEQALAAEALKLRQIETRIAQIEAEGQLDADDVLVRLEPARRLLSLRRVVSSFAEARMAVCVRVGLPEDAHLVTAKIGRFVEINGDVLAGPSREVFLQPPRLNRMHESVVEMQFPIRLQMSWSR